MRTAGNLPIQKTSMRLQVQLGHSAHTMPAPFKAITVSQPVAGARCLGRPLQRAMRVMAAQQRQPDLLSADEVAKAMEFQRRRSQVKAAGAPQAAAASLQVDRCASHLCSASFCLQPDGHAKPRPSTLACACSTLEDDLATRRKQARAWITPHLVCSPCLRHVLGVMVPYACCWHSHQRASKPHLSCHSIA